jgi:sec-independent protein translocase protein TatA
MSIGLPEAVIILLIVLVLFGAGKVPQLMGDLAKGIKTFKAGMKDEIADAGAAPVPPAEEMKRPEPAPAARQDESARG